MYRDWCNRIWTVSRGSSADHTYGSVHDPCDDRILLSGMRRNACNLCVITWQNNNLPVLPSDRCIRCVCGRLVYDLADRRENFSRKNSYRHALSRFVSVDCIGNCNSELPDQESCSCRHRSGVAWVSILPPLLDAQLAEMNLMLHIPLARESVR